MSKYEITNAQYHHFLNSALNSGDILVSRNTVVGANGANRAGDFISQIYYNLSGSGQTKDGATNGGASGINYIRGVFAVDSGFENHYVTYVSWYGPTAFCNYYGWRLPTEWEWQAVVDTLNTAADWDNSAMSWRRRSIGCSTNDACESGMRNEPTFMRRS